MEERYRTISRGMYNWLVDKGFTDTLRYDETPYGKIVFSWAVTPELNEAITEFFITERDIDRRRNAKVVGSVGLYRELERRGYEPFCHEYSIFDFRKRVWLYDPTPELMKAIGELTQNKVNINVAEREQ